MKAFACEPAVRHTISLLSLLVLTTPAFSMTVVDSNTLSTCQTVAPYTYQNGSLVCAGTLNASGQRFQLGFTVSGGTKVSNVKYTFVARTAVVTWFKTETGSLVQVNPLVNDYTLKVNGPAVNALGTTLLDASGNARPFWVEQHFQLVVPLSISGAGAPVFEPLSGSAIPNYIGY